VYRLSLVSTKRNARTDILGRCVGGVPCVRCVLASVLFMRRCVKNTHYARSWYNSTYARICFTCVALRCRQNSSASIWTNTWTNACSLTVRTTINCGVKQRHPTSHGHARHNTPNTSIRSLNGAGKITAGGQTIQKYLKYLYVKYSMTNYGKQMSMELQRSFRRSYEPWTATKSCGSELLTRATKVTKLQQNCRTETIYFVVLQICESLKYNSSSLQVYRLTSFFALW